MLYLLSPAQFPWYAIWMLPFLCFRPWLGLLAVTALVPIYYAAFHFIARDTHEIFRNYVVWVIWIPGVGTARSRGMARAAQSHIISRRDRGQTCVTGNASASSSPRATRSGPLPWSSPPFRHGSTASSSPTMARQMTPPPPLARPAPASSSEPEAGYGAACLAGIAALPEVDIVVFVDGDNSDYPEDMADLVDPIIAGRADLVIGSRVLGQAEAGALTPQQRWGNWLATRLIRLIWGVRFTDLGPFRAISRDALDRLAMADRTYGWTVEMQIKAAELGLTVIEVPVRYRRRIGVSKISGTVRGVVLAGTKILSMIAVRGLADWRGAWVVGLAAVGRSEGRVAAAMRREVRRLGRQFVGLRYAHSDLRLVRGKARRSPTTLSQRHPAIDHLAGGAYLSFMPKQLPIIILPDPILRKVSAPVERVDAELLQLADDMLETMYKRRASASPRSRSASPSASWCWTCRRTPRSPIR